MTEPLARLISARRTVRIAVALIVGQSVLCGVLGWLTMGSEPDRPAGTEALAEPPPHTVLPAVPPQPPPLVEDSAPPAVSSAPPRATTSATPRRRVTAVPTRTRATVRTTSPRPRRSTTPPVTPAPSKTGSTSPSPVAPGMDPPVEVDGSCEKAGATARTTAGVDVRCEKGDDGKLRWRPV